MRREVGADLIKQRFFVPIGLVAIVSLAGACGDGQISAIGAGTQGDPRFDSIEPDGGVEERPDADTGGIGGAGGTAGAGGTPGTGGTPGSGGTPSSGGTGGTPGSGGTGGTPGSGGTGGTPGSGGTGGTPGSGGTAGTPGSGGTGGTPGSGGTGGTPGSGGTGGTPGSGGTGGTPGSGGTGGTPGLPSGPYGYVTPADVGTLVGSGSNGRPTPTETYSGGSINASTVIENKVITGAVTVNADNVVFRNVHFRNNARTMISVATGVDRLTIEDSTIECTATPSESGSKQVLVGEDVTNLTVRRTELTGCSRLFILDGNLDGFLWEYNVRHQVGAGFEPNGHSVGLHIAYFLPTWGDMTIRGSYFRQEDTTSYTDQISFGFSGLSNASLVVQNSYFDQDANYTIRCTASTDCTILDSVFSTSVWVATQFENGAASFECNRRSDGSLIGNSALIGGSANNNNCPSLP